MALSLESLPDLDEILLVAGAYPQLVDVLEEALPHVGQVLLAARPQQPGEDVC